MTDETAFDGIIPAVRDMRDRFARMVEPHRPDLWAYCLRLTGSPWEAEDLSQETLLRAFARLANLWQPMQVKPYLFRIASNTWIDTLRRACITLDPLEEVLEVPSESLSFAAETEEAMAALLRRLPPRQRVIYLLIETLGFSAAEVAGMIGATSGAVKAALHRARETLAATAYKNDASMAVAAPEPSAADQVLLNRFIAAFNNRDAAGLIALLHVRASTDIVGQAEEFGREVITQHSLAGSMNDPTRQIAEIGELWGEPVVLIFAIEHDGQCRLRWMIRLETIGDQICRWRAYFFTPELIRHAAAQLGVPAMPYGYYFGPPAQGCQDGVSTANQENTT